jgi:hypothetical protein
MGGSLLRRISSQLSRHWLPFGVPLPETCAQCALALRCPTYYKRETDVRLILTAQPSAISGYDDSTPDLLDNQSGDYTYLRDDQGLIQTTSYYSSTTAGETTAGGVDGYVYQTSVQHGEDGTAVLQSTTDYFQHSGGGLTVNPVADTTVYRNDNGTGDETTSYAYTWYPGSAQAESITVTLPTVTSGQNGPGTADSDTAFLDSYGRAIWHKDGDGFLWSIKTFGETLAPVSPLCSVVGMLHHFPTGLRAFPAGLGAILHVLVILELLAGGAAQVAAFGAAVTDRGRQGAAPGSQLAGNAADGTAIVAQVHRHLVILVAARQQVSAVSEAGVALLRTGEAGPGADVERWVEGVLLLGTGRPGPQKHKGGDGDQTAQNLATDHDHLLRCQDRKRTSCKAQTPPGRKGPFARDVRMQRPCRGRIKETGRSPARDVNSPRTATTVSRTPSRRLRSAAGRP